ncbi:MAG: hypothetical protein FWG42_11955 [Clostridiales bacterium]|nr:hypothetical protein [Clostridiales bacterium]
MKAIQTQYGLHVRLDALGYMLDYPNLSSHNEYMNLAQDIFKNSEKVVPDLVKGEVYYIRGNDLLRVNSKTGEFISLYPGANSQRVINAINALEK